MYGLLGIIAKSFNKEVASDAVACDNSDPDNEENRDAKLERVMMLQKELHTIYNELDNTKLEDFPEKQREIERIAEVREKLDKLKRELGILPI